VLERWIAGLSVGAVAALLFAVIAPLRGDPLGAVGPSIIGVALIAFAALLLRERRKL